jgi:hypothetical protein
MQRPFFRSTTPTHPTRTTTTRPTRRARCPLWEEETRGKQKEGERECREIIDLAVCISEFLPSPHNNNGEKKKESPWKLGAVRFHLPRLVLWGDDCDRQSQKNQISSHLGRRRAIPNRGLLLHPFHDSWSARPHHVVVVCLCDSTGRIIDPNGAWRCRWLQAVRAVGDCVRNVFAPPTKLLVWAFLPELIREQSCPSHFKS